MRSILAALAALSLATATTASAQVGYTPEKSPFRDIEFRQELTLVTGYFAASKDAAGVAPQSGAMLGAHYEVHVGGPAYFSAELSRVFSQRNVIDPTQNEGLRSLGTKSVPLYLTDVGLVLNLTGQKSLHHLVPLVKGGLGIASDFGGADKGGYKFGTTFAFVFGAGLKYVPGGNLQLRADVTDYLYQIQFPTSYFTANAVGDVVLGAGQARSQYKHNAALTLGASYLFFR
ncbi:MAG TPA: hypothetical protein VFJ74_03065 [Gemmatimonadaceae bacterium]|nr:hypothetical protein [Gemmatimonadaceae bacterium]